MRKILLVVLAFGFIGLVSCEIKEIPVVPGPGESPITASRAFFLCCFREFLTPCQNRCTGIDAPLCLAACADWQRRCLAQWGTALLSDKVSDLCFRECDLRRVDPTNVVSGPCLHN